MFVVILRFSENKSRASELMAGHLDWLRRGFDEGVFVLAGSVQPQLGGAVLAHDATREELEARLRDDPFVVHDVVRVELFEIAASKADPRLAFLARPVAATKSSRS